MSDDEISELAECLWDACRDVTGRGGVIGSRFTRPPKTRCKCPLEALTGCYNTGEIADESGLSREDVSDFTNGFDGFCSVDKATPLFELGRRFQEHALSGRPW